jgi:serine phosphatase RsbU (regulator of sigma subunit)
VQLNSGDCLMLYSDGLTEAHHKKNGHFTTSRLIELLNQYPKASASKLKRIVINEIGRFTEGYLTHDDVTIMIVKIH